LPRWDNYDLFCWSALSKRLSGRSRLLLSDDWWLGNYWTCNHWTGHFWNPRLLNLLSWLVAILAIGRGSVNLVSGIDVGDIEDLVQITRASDCSSTKIRELSIVKQIVYVIHLLLSLS
jgi:hypothetical protein